MFLCSSERVILEIRCLLSGLFTRSDSVGHVLGAALAHLFFQAVPLLWALAQLWYESKSFWKKQASSDLCSVCILQWLHRQLELEFCSVCVSFCWRECKCGFSWSEQRGPAGPLHPRVCAPCLLSLRGKSKMLRSAALCPGLAWIPMAGNERDFYFSVTAIKLAWLYKVFRKYVVRSLIVQPCLVFPVLWEWKICL